jgi:hypothetical protein
MDREVPACPDLSGSIPQTLTNLLLQGFFISVIFNLKYVQSIILEH